MPIAMPGPLLPNESDDFRQMELHEENRLGWVQFAVVAATAAADLIKKRQASKKAKKAQRKEEKQLAAELAAEQTASTPARAGFGGGISPLAIVAGGALLLGGLYLMSGKRRR